MLKQKTMRERGNQTWFIVSSIIFVLFIVMVILVVGLEVTSEPSGMPPPIGNVPQFVQSKCLSRYDALLLWQPATETYYSFFDADTNELLTRSNKGFAVITNKTGVFKEYMNIKIEEG